MYLFTTWKHVKHLPLRLLFSCIRIVSIILLNFFQIDLEIQLFFFSPFHDMIHFNWWSMMIFFRWFRHICRTNLCSRSLITREEYFSFFVLLNRNANSITLTNINEIQWLMMNRGNFYVFFFEFFCYVN